MKTTSMVTHGPAMGAWVTVLCALSGITDVVRSDAGMRLFHFTNVEPLDSQDCPANCHDLFGKLDDWQSGSRGSVQHVEVQERGEPKSGTGFMYEWASGALGHSCAFLQRAYGKGSCRIEWVFTKRTLIFEPHMALSETDTPPCHCDGIERVTITILNYLKHALPVPRQCAYHRTAGLAQTDNVCKLPHGGDAPENEQELWQCVLYAQCPIEDDRLQLVVMRDPRAVVVSSYFHGILHGHNILFGKCRDVDECALAMAPAVVKWMSLRFMLFTRIIEEGRSKLFWYDEAMDDPVSWHNDFYSFVSLNMPGNVVREAANLSDNGATIFGFPSKGLDNHPGERIVINSTVNTFREKLQPATIKEIDELIRNWFPPAMLEKLNQPQ